MRLETTGEKELLHLRAASIPQCSVSAIGIGDTYRRTETVKERKRDGATQCRFLRLALAPGSCLAHKESSKSPFLPTFLPLSSCSCFSSRNLFPSVPLLPRLSSLNGPSSLPSAPFLAALPHANARTKRNCSRGSSGPPPARVPPGPLDPHLRLFGLFVYLAKFDSPTRSDLTSRSLLVPLPLHPFMLRALLSSRFPSLASPWFLVLVLFL